MSWLNFALVFIGGGLGSICRYAISLLLVNQTSQFPWATLWANVISCFILGLLVGMNAQNLVPYPARVLLMTGFCGGFSTFSTFSNENFHLFHTQAGVTAFLYIGASLVAGMICILIGIKAGQSFG